MDGCNPLKIAILAPLSDPVRRTPTGGTGDMVHVLAREYVRRGHEVTVFAHPDSDVAGNLVSSEADDVEISRALTLDLLQRRSASFDLLHSFWEVALLPLAASMECRILLTVCEMPGGEGTRELLHNFAHIPMVAPTASASDYLPAESLRDTIPYCTAVPEGFEVRAAENYLAYVGDLSRERGIGDVLRVALLAGVPLKIAGPVPELERDFFETWIEPACEHELVDYLGARPADETHHMLAGALGLVSMAPPSGGIGWPLVESVRLGTPILTAGGAGASDVVREGFNGFVVSGPADASRRVPGLRALDRGAIAADAERFSAVAAADAYETLYRELLS